MRVRISITVAALGLCAALAPVSAAQAGSTSTGSLTLTVKEAPFFVKGAQGGVIDACGTPGAPLWSSTQVRQGISAMSSYAITGWDISTVWAETGPEPWTHFAQSAPPVVSWLADNYDATCGGGSGQDGTIYRVTDAHGQTATLESDYQLDVVRWNNDNANSEDPGRTGLGAWSFTGVWHKVNCPSCDGGTQTYSTAQGAAARFAVPTNWASQYSGWVPQSMHLGLMVSTGPGHGRADLYLDGTRVATIDTLSATTSHRMYVWDFGPLGPGAHTVRVVNRHTAGRPRVDVNAMGVLRGTTFVPTLLP